MVRYICAMAALALAAPAAHATVVNINFASTDNGMGGPISGNLTFDTRALELVDLTRYDGIDVATYRSPSFQWTYDLFGENQFTTPYFVQVGDYSDGNKEFYFFNTVPGTRTNLNFVLRLTGEGTNLPTSGYENQFAYLTFVNLNATSLGDYYLGYASAAYSVSYANAVPEPATWAMMIGGVGMVGGVLRRRRTSRPLAAAA